MTPDPNLSAERARVDAWIESDLEVAMAESEYGRALHDLWRTGSPNIGNYLAARFHQIPGGDSEYNRSLVDALRNGDASSYYKAMLMQALFLAQTADRAKRGAAQEKIRITFLPSNSRYAAIYEPHVAKGWFVIAVDWSVLCALMTVAAVLSHCVQGKVEKDGAMEWLLTPESAIKHFDDNPRFKTMLIEGLTPAILPSLPPIAPIFGAEPHQAVFGIKVLKATIFGLVAHEYAHALRGHFYDERRATDLRSQLEHEADGISIFLALCDPWAEMARSPNDYDPQERTFSVAGCLLLQSLLKMLQMGDRIAADFTGKPPRSSTHPDPMVRLRALRDVMDILAPHNTRQRQEVDMFANFLINFVDGIWNRSVDDLVQHLRRKDALLTRSVTTMTSAELRFW